MKKLTVLCLKADRDVALERLRELGVLHVIPAGESGSDDARETQHALARAQSALGALSRFATHKRQATPRPDLDPVTEVHSLLLRREEAMEKLSNLRTEIKAAEPLGDFDPAVVAALREKGLFVRLYREKSHATPEAPAGAVLIELGHGHAGRFLAVASDSPVELDGEECPLPARRLSAMRHEAAETEKELAAVHTGLAEMGKHTDEITQELRSLEQRLRLLEVRDGMGAAGAVAYLAGFCPKDAVPAVRQEATKNGWGLVDADPSPDEEVPTLIRNPAWVRPISLMFSLIGVTPGYREADISAAFLLFYSVFFAMLVGDAGYGVLFLVLTLAIRPFARKAPRDLFRLLALLSLCTIAWGTATGSWFGAERIPAPLRAVRVDWLREDNNLMRLCFLIGAIHLTLAHVWAAVRSWNRLTALAELGWIAITWTIYFGVGLLVLGRPFPDFARWLFIVGICLVVIFMTPPRALKRDLHKHIMLPLTLVGNFGDLISYVRLFAVGSATAAIAMAFNEMAIGSGISGPGQAIVASLILLVAHGLNILLCALAVLVHGVRLNTLEFCGQMGMQWTGFPYRPFAKERTRQ
ncbi:MAG: hypothetical protein FJ224_12675 [Lentisphaerae bacterium]|nr:hypothetical protein [Lentisphaerota bacterium]